MTNSEVTATTYTVDCRCGGTGQEWESDGTPVGPCQECLVRSLRFDIEDALDLLDSGKRYDAEDVLRRALNGRNEA